MPRESANKRRNFPEFGEKLASLKHATRAQPLSRPFTKNFRLVVDKFGKVAHEYLRPVVACARPSETLIGRYPQASELCSLWPSSISDVRVALLFTCPRRVSPFQFGQAIFVFRHVTAIVYRPRVLLSTMYLVDSGVLITGASTANRYTSGIDRSIRTTTYKFSLFSFASCCPYFLEFFSVNGGRRSLLVVCRLFLGRKERKATGGRARIAKRDWRTFGTDHGKWFTVGYARNYEAIRGNGGGRLGGRRAPLRSRFSLLSLTLSVSLFCFPHPPTAPPAAPPSPSRPRVAVAVASKLGQSLVAVASRFGDSKEGSFLFLLISFFPRPCPSSPKLVPRFFSLRRFSSFLLCYSATSPSLSVSFLPFARRCFLARSHANANIRVGRAANRNQTRRYLWLLLLDFRSLLGPTVFRSYGRPRFSPRNVLPPDRRTFGAWKIFGGGTVGSRLQISPGCRLNVFRERRDSFQSFKLANSIADVAVDAVVVGIVGDETPTDRTILR